MLEVTRKDLVTTRTRHGWNQPPGWETSRTTTTRSRAWDIASGTTTANHSLPGESRVLDTAPPNLIKPKRPARPWPLPERKRTKRTSLLRTTAAAYRPVEIRWLANTCTHTRPGQARNETGQQQKNKWNRDRFGSAGDWGTGVRGWMARALRGPRSGRVGAAGGGRECQSVGKFHPPFSSSSTDPSSDTLHSFPSSSVCVSAYWTGGGGGSCMGGKSGLTIGDGGRRGDGTVFVCFFEGTSLLPGPVMYLV